jgi:phosphoenolpyruvate phosphomutase
MMSFTYRKDSHDLKRVLAEGRKLRLIEVHSGLSTIIANEAQDKRSGLQFDGVWISSLTSMASFGLPDLELSVLDSRLSVIEQVTRTSAKPVVVDGATGGDVSSVRYLCQALMRFGVGAVIFEDKAYPKRNSLVGSDQRLMDPYEFAEKIATARDAVGNGGLMILGRIESLISGESLEDALHRAAIYVAAGAEGILIHSKAKTAGEITAFAHRFRARYPAIPLFCVPTTYHGETAAGLFAAGFDAVIYANHLLRAAHAAMERACVSILANDLSSVIEPEIASTERIFDDVGYTAEMQRLSARSAISPVRARSHG